MSLIQNIKRFNSKKQNTKEAILLCGFGGAIWQTKRLISVLNRAGYNVTALDFPKKVLGGGDPTLLPQMVDEVAAFVVNEAKSSEDKILLIGISLGSLLSLNIFRRSKLFDTAIMITGGNIVTVAQNIYGRRVWPQSHDELSDIWKEVNIFTDPKLLKGKRALFVLPSNDKLIDPAEVIAEAERQSKAGNSIQLIKRGRSKSSNLSKLPMLRSSIAMRLATHIWVIVEETIIFPKRVLSYIERVENQKP